MKPLSIMVVDDHAETRRALQLWLEAYGHTAVTAATGHEAMQHLADGKIDLVITDVLMPDGNGIELIAKIKKTRPHLRVLAISGGGPQATSSTCLHRAHSAGADALLLKPFKQDQLLNAMRYVLGGDVQRVPAGSSVLDRQPPSQQLRVFSGIAEMPTVGAPVRSRESI
jgi:CheY-like chemotaxis protein